MAAGHRTARSEPATGDGVAGGGPQPGTAADLAPGPTEGRLIPGAGEGRLMQIGEAAERVGLSIRTIRHYEDVGLIVPSARSDGGFRLYTAADLDRLAVVKRMKPLGFTLDEMRDLLAVLDALDNAAARPPRPEARTPAEGGDRAALLDRLGMFHAAATTRVSALRDQLATAEGFADTLRARLDQHGGGSPL